jgi:TPR repeat protein
MSKEAETLYERAKILLQGKHDNDPAEIFALLYAAAEQGHAEAQVEVGRYYHYGKITSKNFRKAAYYYSLAAEQYNADGLVRLAKCYLHNASLYGLEENTREALEDKYWYDKKAFALLKKAAKQGYASAFYEIADFLEQGKGGLDERKVGHAGDGFDEERREGFLTIDCRRSPKVHHLIITC